MKRILPSSDNNSYELYQNLYSDTRSQEISEDADLEISEHSQAIPYPDIFKIFQENTFPELCSTLVGLEKIFRKN